CRVEPAVVRRSSRSRFDGLVNDRIDVPSKLFIVDVRRVSERLDEAFTRHEMRTPDRAYFGDGAAVHGDDEILTGLAGAQDFAALVPEFALADLPRHAGSVAHVLQARLEHRGGRAEAAVSRL